MSKEDKLRILIKTLGNYYNSGGPEYSFYCPFCNHHKKKLAVRIDKGFHCWICEVSGKNLGFLVRRFGTAAQKIEWSRYDQTVDLLDFDNLFGEDEIEEIRRVALPDSFVSLANKNGSISAKMARRYLASRGITSADILKWKIGYATNGEYSGRIIIPSFDNEGILNYFVTRTYTNQFPTYMIPDASKDIIFNELMFDWDKDVTIVEGVFDAMKAENAIPLLGSSMRAGSYILQKIAEHKTKVFIALDKDAQWKAQKIINILKLAGIEVFQIGLGDHEDVGEMTKDEFQGFKNSSQIMDFENYLISKIGVL